MLDEAQRRLRALITEHGPWVVDDRPRCRNLIHDYGLGDRGTVNVLIAALDENIPSDLRKPMRPGTPDLMMAGLRGRLQTHHGQTEDASRWAVETWAVALGLREDAHQRPRAVEADIPPTTDGAERQARPTLKRPALKWSISAIVIAVTIAVYSVAAIHYTSEKTRSMLLVQGLQQQLDQRRIYPAAKLNLTANAYVAKDHDGDTLTISFTMDGATGHASGTLQEFGKQSVSFNWQLSLNSITAYLADGSSDFMIFPDNPDVRFIRISKKSDGKYYISSICRGFFKSMTSGCFA